MDAAGPALRFGPAGRDVISAIIEFGKIDAIGHTLIIVVLLVILADDARAKNKIWYAALAPAGYAVALAVFLGAYYFTHSLLFGIQPVV